MANSSINPEIPVYIFTGFLEAGKTTFIQQTLENEEFNSGEPTLVLLCEEGEIGLEAEKYPPQSRVRVQVVRREADLSRSQLFAWLREAQAVRVIVEYNGMWPLASLLEAMPDNWVIHQEFAFFETGSFLLYNKNMRELVVDKLTGCELAVFNRFPPGADKTPFHRVVRATNRQCDIAYEDPEENVEYDDIEDPLPFDVDAPIVEIGDRDYAFWYRDMSEETIKYHGKTVRFIALAMTRTKLPPGRFVAGRQLMTCCEQDIQFAGLICHWGKCPPLPDNTWVEITARIQVSRRKNGQLIPELHLKTAEQAPAPQPTVASFF